MLNKREIISGITEQVKDYIAYSNNDQPERAAWALEGAIEDATDEIFDGDRARARQYVMYRTQEEMYK